ncbi:hypothetical protein HBH51_150840 [Parastagonospora nodorum]|nr:hypothetical protein HBH51_150840 [Parastagonospora nodorum]KAH5393066.1 hypothetical protein HBI33_001330 [Parastagonospora nodorum]
MPSIFSKKSNRSHPSADTTPGQLSPNPSVNNDGAQRYQPVESQQSVPQGQRHSQQLPQGVSQAQYQQPFPTRTTSVNRLSAHLDQAAQSYQQQQQQQQQQQPGPPQLSPALDQTRQSAYQPQSPPPVVQEQKKSLRSRIAAGLSGHNKDDDASKQAGKNGVGRRQSVRKSDPRLAEQQAQENQRLQAQQHWHQGSSSHLLSSTEQDEDNLDPFLQQDDHPEVPPKDYPQHLQHPQQQQQFVANPQQQQYRPPLDRVSTEGSYRTQGGVSQYSPDHHQGQGLQPQQQPGQQQQQQQYQSYQPAVQTSQNPNEYQAFNPQNSPSPLLVNAQAHGQASNSAPQQQQVYYQQQEQSPQQAQGHSPQDHPQQGAHYQQQHFAPPSQPQPHPTQELQHQIGRTSAQQPPELQHPQAIRAPLQLVQNQQIDAQQSQQLRPPSSHQLGPPSPLQNPPYTPYDAQSGQQHTTHSSDPSLANTTPPRKSQDSMPPSANSGRNTLRKVVDGQQPGPPSREASLLQQPSGQASQGQPYRGEKGQAQQGGEMGRATPPPWPSVADMSEEEFEKIMKEHEVLREKYQKVKRYFFEQQTQVHQLQNTLANQRLSLSRTSWDDSEYGTRFNRLDGLIAQLSFSVRKDWKAIPQFLHPVVNKTAVETGKQEMTAVGRAFISNWLVENIFEKYFHPDLEPGFSTQLQMIVSNIRKFSPPSHSPEDEDSLAAKIINWRLATLEGLAETLRAPQAAKYRQELIDTLNEKLIASLQMHMNDPAPADLNGGVPMIIELAISVAQHLPLESREVHIEYFPPGHGIVPEFMKLESGIPALTAPILEVDEADRASVRSNARSDIDNASIAEQEQLAAQAAPKEEKKRGVFGFGGGSKKPTTAPASLGKRESTLGAGGSQQSLTPNPPGSSHGPKDEVPAQRVRMAVGFAVQIRGKSILMKAPVYST